MAKITPKETRAYCFMTFDFVCSSIVLMSNNGFKFVSLHRDGQCPEYSGEEEAICAVGLVKAKPGIFVEAIQYLLILATPVEVIVFILP